MPQETPEVNNDIRHEAAGNLAFLLSVIRCREDLSPTEEENVRRVIRDLQATQPDAEAVRKLVEAARAFDVPHQHTGGPCRYCAIREALKPFAPAYVQALEVQSATDVGDAPVVKVPRK